MFLISCQRGWWSCRVFMVAIALMGSAVISAPFALAALCYKPGNHIACTVQPCADFGGDGNIACPFEKFYQNLPQIPQVKQGIVGNMTYLVGESAKCYEVHRCVKVLVVGDTECHKGEWQRASPAYSERYPTGDVCPAY